MRRAVPVAVGSAACRPAIGLEKARLFEKVRRKSLNAQLKGGRISAFCRTKCAALDAIGAKKFRLPTHSR